MTDVREVMFVDRERGAVVVLTGDQFKKAMGLTPAMETWIRSHYGWSDKEVELNDT